MKIKITQVEKWNGERPMGNWNAGWMYEHNGRKYASIGLRDDKPSKDDLIKEAMEHYEETKNINR